MEGRQEPTFAVRGGGEAGGCASLDVEGLRGKLEVREGTPARWCYPWSTSP